MKLKINTKLVLLAIFLVGISCLVVGIVGYKAAEKAFNKGIEDRLQDQAKDWKLLAEAYNEEIVGQEQRVRGSANSIVTAQTKSVYELIDKALKDNGGTLTPQAREDILNRLSKQTVGKTGYIWILTYNGTYVLSKDRKRDGENVWNIQDSNNNYVIRDLIAKGRAVNGSDIAYHSYPWLNAGENVSREKIAAMVHIEELGWIVGVSTYYDDLVDMGYRQRTMEHVKDLAAKQIIGSSGYIWVVDSNGKYVVSKNRLRDGEDISMAKDTNGVLFIKDAVLKAKASGEGTALEIYPWLNKGETTPRLKVAGLAYMPEWDWVIGVSAYYDDFSGKGALSMVRNSLIIIGIIVLLFGIALAFFLANSISAPLRRMTAAGNKIADGDINEEIPSIKSGDEVEDLGVTMTLLVGAIKFLKKETGADKESASHKSKDESLVKKHK